MTIEHSIEGKIMGKFGSLLVASLKNDQPQMEEGFKNALNRWKLTKAEREEKLRIDADREMMYYRMTSDGEPIASIIRYNELKEENLFANSGWSNIGRGGVSSAKEN